MEYFENADKKLEDVRKKALEGIKYYEKLESISRKRIFSKEFQKILKKIKKLNNYMEKDYMAETVNDSIKGMELALRPQIYQLQDDRQTEGRHCKTGKSYVVWNCSGSRRNKRDWQTIRLYNMQRHET